MPTTAVGIKTYVDTMSAIEDLLEGLKEGVKDFESTLVTAEQVGAQEAIGSGSDSGIDTTDGSRVRAILDTMEDDCYQCMMIIYGIYLQIVALEV